MMLDGVLFYYLFIDQLLTKNYEINHVALSFLERALKAALTIVFKISIN